MNSWQRLPCSLADVRLDFVLACGQSFRWTKTLEVWEGVIGSLMWRLKQGGDCIEYQVFGKIPGLEDENGDKDTDQSKRATEDPSTSGLSTLRENSLNTILSNYLALETSLGTLYDTWTRADHRFAELAPKFPGIRILQQNFLENLFTFICSSNNNIQRIQQMVEKLCIKYGPVICELNGRQYHAFPEISLLAAETVQAELRELGFGYRAPFVQKSAKFITDNPEWLEKVTKADYATAKAMLMELPGVGAKVADCVCLMSLGHHGAVPVDTHVFSVTSEHYLPHLRGKKSVTNKVYDEIGDFYRERFGPMAGWAHSILFTADLARFKDRSIDKEKQPTKRKKNV